MSTRRRLKYSGGKLAIYDIDSAAPNDAPLTSPLSHVDRLHFHSDLVYPAIIGTYTGSINLPAIAANTIRTASTNIAAHGRAGTPYVEGKVLIGSVWVPLAGSVPVVQQSGAAPAVASFARFLALGANGTNIILNEYSISHATTAYGSVSFSYVIYLTDFLVA